MNTQQKFEFAGNGSTEFFAKLKSLLANKTAKVAILPTRVPQTFLLVGGVKA